MGTIGTIGNVDRIRTAIANASRSTGMDFDYLLGQAQLESGLNPSARAGTSSATGLYQFIDQSWLGIIKQHGGENGLGWAANAITRSGNRWVVADPSMKAAILNLRNNPEVSATMAAEFASDNRDSLEKTLGRGATGTDLYMAHFLGLGGATNFLKTMATNPGASGAAMFPAAATANRSIFYDASGNPRSLGDIYQRFAAKLDKGGAKAGATGFASDALDGSGAVAFENQYGTSAFETAKANFAQLQTMTGLASAEIIPGTADTKSGATDWARAAMARVNGGQPATAPTDAATAVNLLRPTPDNARLAYLMLSSLGA